MAEEMRMTLEGTEEKLNGLKDFLSRYLADSSRPQDCCWENEVAALDAPRDASPVASVAPASPRTCDALQQQRTRHSQVIAGLRQRIEEQEREIAALTREHSSLVNSRRT